MNRSRLEELQSQIRCPFLVKKPENLFYLLGQRVRHGYLLVKSINHSSPVRGEGREGVVFFGDGLEKVEGLRNTDRLKSLGKYLSRRSTLMLEDVFTFAEFSYIKEKLKNPPHPSPLPRSRGRGGERGRGVKLKVSRSPVDELRAIKDPAEIRAIRRSMQMVEKVFQIVKTQLSKKSWTEIQLSRYIRELGHRFGAEDASFPPIVAAGLNAAVPHHQPSKKKLKAGESIIIDMGFTVGGYCSDFTRTIFLKRAPKRLAIAYNQVEKAYWRAIELARPGVKAKKLYETAVGILAEKKLDKYFIHNLGHGAGLEIHELPNLSPDSQEVLQTGMVFSVEPGVYIPKLGGVRIEDLVYLQGRVKKFIHLPAGLKENVIL